MMHQSWLYRANAACRLAVTLVFSLSISLSATADEVNPQWTPAHTKDTSINTASSNWDWKFQPGSEPAGRQPIPEVTTLRMAQQFGLGYLPLMIVRQNQLIEKRAREAGLGNLRVTWARFPSGPAMHEALITGLLDFAAGGIAPLVRVWDKTQGKQNVRGVVALGSMPIYLNTVNPDVKRLADISKQDRIALPAIRDSIQAVVLQMAAAQAFGDTAYNRLDPITVSMAHPVAMDALLGNSTGGITAHFTSPPFQYQELNDERVRRILSSYDVLGGPATFNLVWTRSQFYEDTPKTYAVVVAAIREAMSFINRDPVAAAKIYLLQSGNSMSVEDIVEIITDPLIEYTVTPQSVMKVAQFMHKTGAIEAPPGDWRDLFFANLHNEPGS
ncbi:MAG: ABC transporter substrate-binding protein [Gammaproteobacteria bacterium]